MTETRTRALDSGGSVDATGRAGIGVALRASGGRAGTTDGRFSATGGRLDGMVPDEADGWAALYGEVLRSGKPIRFERELVATGRHLELAAFRIEPPSRRQVAVLFQDITARKRAETALHRLNDNLECDAKNWLDKAAEKPGSWWPDWDAWMKRHSSGTVPAPARPGNASYPLIEPAPGRYVKQRSN